MMDAPAPPLVSCPLVSCLCVTEGRAAFMPWLLWCFDSQAWPVRELVIVDSSVAPFDAGGRGDVRVVAAPPGSSVAHKRNLALRAAQGEIITWFDDDDWQHPHKVTWLVEALAQGAPYAGSRRAWFVNLMTRHCTPFGGPRQAIIFNSGAFVREAVMATEFPENMRVASDTRWMQALHAQLRGRGAVVDREDLFFWLCHDQNLSNPAQRRRFTHTIDMLKARIGAEAWGDTEAALDALQQRLSAPTQLGVTATHRQPQARAKAQRRQQPRPTEPLDGQPLGDQPQAAPESAEAPVSAMIKATVLDVPYLDTMVRHMLAQAHYPFVERTIIVDRPQNFAGKYRDRPRASDADLNRVLDGLLADGVIDQVREVDMTPAVVQEVMERYFMAGSGHIPTHAVSGGPIYATLFGLESMPTDTVLQMDADLFFYSEGESWVKQALGCLCRDPRLWLMMTHPGPPAGAAGRSLAGINAQRASWDAALAIWRFRTATSRYFLCDRRNLHQRLQPVPSQGGCAPLEQCISQALQRHGACRGNLGNLQSWHIHGWSHREPFPTWAPAIAAAVADGRVPATQRGDYDLRLDREPDRLVWQRFLTITPHERNEPPAAAPPAAKVAQITPSRQQEPPVSILPAASGAPLAVILPVRDRAGQRLRNALHSLQWQTMGKPSQIVVVSHGSQAHIDQELAQICQTEEATLLTIGAPEQPWNKPLALNTGIRATSPSVPFVMTMDIDMILAPNFVQTVVAELQVDPPALVLCQSADLPAAQNVPSDRQQLLTAFPHLQHTCRLRGHTGSGGVQAARRDFFYEIRGYDEDLLWWGAMDGDIVTRAQLLGLRVVWIEKQTAMLHQWHPRKHASLTQSSHIAAAQRAWQHNHALVRERGHTPQRNPQRWGGITD